MALQDGVTRKYNRKTHDMGKAAMLIETKKQVMHYKLKIKEEMEAKNKDKLDKMRAERRKRRAAKQRDKDQNMPF